MDAEKRIYPRKKAPSVAATMHDSQGYYNGMVSDISLKGLSLVVGKDGIQYGERYDVKFSLPVRGRYLPVLVQGCAIHSAECGEMGSKIGLQLAAIDTLSLWTIEAFLKASYDAPASIGYKWDSPRII